MVAAVSLLTVGVTVSQVQAAEVVALGASNTRGKGVSYSQAYPAHLQRMLRGRGVGVTVRNAGINGNTTGQMLARLNSVISSNTRVVILQPGGNDRRRGRALGWGNPSCLFGSWRGILYVQ